MSAPPSQARAVVIGGGIVGCSTAYHLAKNGWTDVVVLAGALLNDALEKGPYQPPVLGLDGLVTDDIDPACWNGLYCDRKEESGSYSSPSSLYLAKGNNSGSIKNILEEFSAPGFWGIQYESRESSGQAVQQDSYNISFKGENSSFGVYYDGGETEIYDDPCVYGTPLHSFNKHANYTLLTPYGDMWPTSASGGWNNEGNFGNPILTYAPSGSSTFDSGIAVLKDGRYVYYEFVSILIYYRDTGYTPKVYASVRIDPNNPDERKPPSTPGLEDLVKALLSKYPDDITLTFYTK